MRTHAGAARALPTRGEAYLLPMSTAAAYAPGRVELLGNHTDYNQGLVLAAAIDRGLTVSGRSRADATAVLASAALGRRVEVPLDAVLEQLDDAWASYSLGVVRELQAAGFAPGGFEAEIAGELPPGGGLSSSAALEVATALFLAKLHGWDLAPMALAKLCHRAENEFVGVQSGLLDQATSVFGREGHAVFLDCRSEEIRLVPFPPDLALIIAPSGEPHALVAGEYNARRAECTAAAAVLGVASLRDITPEELRRRGDALPDILRRRALHVAEENARVAEAVAAMERGDAEAFGALMFASHESSRRNFENSTPALDRLVERARPLPGVLGARLTGGGFGGSILVLAAADRADEVAQELRNASGHAGGGGSAPFLTVPSDGAR